MILFWPFAFAWYAYTIWLRFLAALSTEPLTPLEQAMREAEARLVE